MIKTNSLCNDLKLDLHLHLSSENDEHLCAMHLVTTGDLDFVLLCIPMALPCRIAHQSFTCHNPLQLRQNLRLLLLHPLCSGSWVGSQTASLVAECGNRC
jgi:hypothetical protein